MTEVQNISLLDARIADAVEDVINAQAKLASLRKQKENESLIEQLAVGQRISAEYGRAEKRRLVTGTITAIGDDPKLGRLVAITIGEGLDVQLVKVRAADVIFNTEAVNDGAE